MSTVVLLEKTHTADNMRLCRAALRVNLGCLKLSGAELAYLVNARCPLAYASDKAATEAIGPCRCPARDSLSVG